jgi:hypothetical protein
VISLLIYASGWCRPFTFGLSRHDYPSLDTCRVNSRCFHVVERQNILSGGKVPSLPMYLAFSWAIHITISQCCEQVPRKQVSWPLTRLFDNLVVLRGRGEQVLILRSSFALIPCKASEQRPKKKKRSLGTLLAALVLTITNLRFSYNFNFAVVSQM